MKFLTACLVGLCVLLAGCAASPVSMHDAEPVSLTTKDTALTTPGQNKAPITFIYGSGFMAGCPGVHVFLSMNGDSFASLLHSQKATIYLVPGNYYVVAEIGRGSICVDSQTGALITVINSNPQIWNVLTGQAGVSLTPAN